MGHGVVVVAMALLAVGCQGVIGEPGPDPGDDPPTPVPDPPRIGPDRFVCDESITAGPSPMRRLTARQYENTLNDLAQTLLGERVDFELDLLPREDGTDYRRLDQGLSQLHVDAYFQIGNRFAEEATGTAERIERLAGVCATDGDPANDTSCVRDFVQRVGRLAFRRPLTDDEIDFYAADAMASVDDVSATAFRERLAVLLMTPDFLYLVEDELPEAEPGVYPLSGHELATRIAYHFWQSMPDDLLLQAAADGTLDTDDGYRRQVERVFDDPRTDRTLDQFVAEWLQLERLPELDAALGTPAYDNFVGDDVPGSDLREHMIGEVQAAFRYHVGRDATLADLLRSSESFATTEDLATIYGVPVWDGAGARPPFADGRGGLLSRAALVATGSIVTHPILKGVAIRTRVLCDTIPPPPMDVPPPPELSPEMTIREQVEELTQREGTACATCHSMINPLGFVTEGFDGLGRRRDVERVFDRDTGELMVSLPVDTSAEIELRPGETVRIASGAELSTLVADSGRAEGCFARHYFRFAYGRVENLQADGCALEGLRTSLLEGGSLRAMLLAVAMQPEFRTRRVALDSQGGTP